MKNIQIKSCEELAISFANLANMAHMDKNSNFQIPVIESLSFVKILTYQKDLWDISANVKNFFVLFATQSFSNFRYHRTAFHRTFCASLPICCRLQ